MPGSRASGLVCEPAPIRLGQVPPAHPRRHTAHDLRTGRPGARSAGDRPAGSASDRTRVACRGSPRRRSPVPSTPTRCRSPRPRTAACSDTSTTWPTCASTSSPRTAGSDTRISVRSTCRCAGTSTAPPDTADPSNLSATESIPNRARSPQLAATLLRLRLLAPYRDHAIPYGVRRPRGSPGVRPTPTFVVLAANSVLARHPDVKISLAELGSEWFSHCFAGSTPSTTSIAACTAHRGRGVLLRQRDGAPARLNRVGHTERSPSRIVGSTGSASYGRCIETRPAMSAYAAEMAGAT